MKLREQRGGTAQRRGETALAASLGYFAWCWARGLRPLCNCQSKIRETAADSEYGQRSQRHVVQPRSCHRHRQSKMRVIIRLLLLLCLGAGTPSVSPAAAQQAKPNILVIMGDDIGYWNISAYNRGLMGYRTPNIDRLADEGAIFTDYYGQQSCTAGRAAFITGQSPLRTGLLKVGLPSAKEGLSAEDPTIAELLKPLGYATAQFGKNHLGDRNQFLPTVHGFDEFFGNLYHLNAEDEPEHPDYPKTPGFRAQFGPRGVLKCKASNTDDATV